eukprot:3406068-Rhodomonas_salina.1
MALGRTGIPMLKLGGGESIRLGAGVLGGIEEQVPDGVIEGEQRKLMIMMECCLRKDNDEGAIEERAEEKEEKYHSARTLLQLGLRKALGLDWNVKHVLFITGWKTSIMMDKSKTSDAGGQQVLTVTLTKTIFSLPPSQHCTSVPRRHRLSLFKGEGGSRLTSSLACLHRSAGSGAWRAKLSQSVSLVTHKDCKAINVICCCCRHSWVEVSSLGATSVSTDDQGQMLYLPSLQMYTDQMGVSSPSSCKNPSESFQAKCWGEGVEVIERPIMSIMIDMFEANVFVFLEQVTRVTVHSWLSSRRVPDQDEAT